MPPQAPMPPPLSFDVGGAFPGIVEGPPLHGSPFPDDDWDRDGFDDFDRKPKKDKKKKDKEDKLPVEIKYEGYTLEKATPRFVGERDSWARVGRRALPFDDKQLADLVKRHRKKSGTNPEQDFKLLSSNQQGVVNRLILERKQQEKNKNADWVLDDVQKFGKYGWTKMEVKRVQAILKRVDKNKEQTGQHSMRGNKNSYQEFEIIDLAVDPSKKKDGNNAKKPKKARSFDDFDPLDDPLGLGTGIPPPQKHVRNNSNQQMPRDNIMDPFAQIPPPPMGPPPGAIPVHEHHGPNQPPFQQQFQPSFPASARQSFHNPNPFQPLPEVASPMQFDLPPMDSPPWPHPHQGGMDRPQARSQSRGDLERKPSNRRPSVDAKKFRQLEDKVDDLNSKMRNWQVGSDSSDYEEESIFSQQSDGRSFSPPSSPRSYFSDVKGRGSLERRRSSTSRDPRYHARYRSHRYRDAEVEPGYTYRSERRDYPPEVRREGRRPSLHHAHTYDDYPVGRSAEPRYLPSRRPLQRRLTEYGEDYARDYDEVPQLRSPQPRRDSRQFDPVREAYEAGRREAMDARRRSSYVGGGGSYYD